MVLRVAKVSAVFSLMITAVLLWVGLSVNSQDEFFSSRSGEIDYEYVFIFFFVNFFSILSVIFLIGIVILFVFVSVRRRI